LLEGKTCLVTGSTSGIGKEIAIGLGRLGASVILVGRSQEKCRSAAREVAGFSSNQVPRYFVADLSSQQAIRNLASEVTSALDHLDVLVNNAGIFMASREVSPEGIELTFAVNHLAPFLLTNLLLGLLKKTPSARIVTTSSIAHRGAHIDFDDINFETKKYSGIRAYGQSKLANILFTRELARRLSSAGANVTANCFHPGGVRTNFMRNNPLAYKLVWAVAAPFLISAQKGADTGIFLASSPDIEGVSGKYFVKRRQVVPSSAAQSDESASRLWSLSEKMTSA
jgi:NAD(P)-dependent dehydrogenase (short-subunit alcohol dehydrogenase family)